MTAQIILTETEVQGLDALSRQTGKTRDQLIHEALERLLAADLERRRELMRQGRGIWKNRTDLPDFEAMRAECDRVKPPE